METILLLISSLAIPAAVLIPVLTKGKSTTAFWISAACNLVVILCRSLALQYEFNLASVLIITLAAATLLFDGLNIEQLNAQNRYKAETLHAQWVQVICHDETDDGFIDKVHECCSRCHMPNGKKTPPYCPSCGAKMDLVKTTLE